MNSICPSASVVGDERTINFVPVCNASLLREHQKKKVVPATSGRNTTVVKEKMPMAVDSCAQHNEPPCRILFPDPDIVAQEPRVCDGVQDLFRSRPCDGIELCLFCF